MKPDFFPAHKIQPRKKYYAITLLGDEQGNMITSPFTGWAGPDEEDERFEWRTLSEIIPENMAHCWEGIREPFQVVNTYSEFVQWYLSGGNAIISKTLVKKFLPGQLVPKRCVREGEVGFTAVSLLPQTALQKAPTPKVRMKVIQRDEYRCMICGQRPTEDVNIQLHVHHVRPFSEGGVTTEKNLITLCHTCHIGLDPHFEYQLFDLLDVRKRKGVSEAQLRLRDHINGILLYRKALKARLAEMQSATKHRKG